MYQITITHHTGEERDGRAYTSATDADTEARLLSQEGFASVSVWNAKGELHSRWIGGYAATAEDRHARTV